MKKIIHIFGLKIVEIETLSDAQALAKEKPNNPKGAILDATPDELAKQREREVLKKYDNQAF